MMKITTAVQQESSMSAWLVANTYTIWHIAGMGVEEDARSDTRR
jgi:hypothetical protein